MKKPNQLLKKIHKEHQIANNVYIFSSVTELHVYKLLERLHLDEKLLHSSVSQTASKKLSVQIDERPRVGARRKGTRES